jgi:NDP-sugar pyrophosphorylase family protein
MVAMILAAGRGTRLAKLGLSVPKILVDVGGVPLLVRQLHYLEREGVTRVVINAHHLAGQIVAFARTYRGPLELKVMVERELLGTAGGVRNALDLLGEAPFLTLYGDVIVDAPVTPILSAHSAWGASATLTTYSSEELVGKGVLEVDNAGRVTRFVEKERRRGTGLVNAGLYVLEPGFIAQLETGVELDFGHDVLPTAIERGERVFAYELRSPVIDIGTPAALAEARRCATSHGTRGTRRGI